MVGPLADCAINRVVIACELFTFSALLALACQFATSADFDEDKVPALVQDGLDMLRDVDDSARRYHLVITVHVAVVQLVKPERVLLTTIFIQIGNV